MMSPTSSFAAHQPPCERCGHAQITHDGRPDNRWLLVAEFRAEMNALHANELDPALTYAEHEDYKALTRTLMKKARGGTVRFGGDRPEGLYIERTGFVIELRPTLERRPAFGRKPRLLRLYLAEPAEEQFRLLGLHLATKADSADGLHEQNESIDVAVGRGIAWASSR